MPTINSALTKAAVRTQVRQLIHDEGGKLWVDANLDLLIGLVFDSKWSDMLNFRGKITSQLDTIATLTSPGYINLQIAADSGDLSQRFYRVQSVTRNATQYLPADERFITIEGATVKYGGPSSCFYVRGDEMWLFPLNTTDDVEIRYAFLPTRFDLLTNDATRMSWPVGHEAALIFEAAALAMSKGGLEDPSTLLELADRATHRMFASIERDGNWAVTPATSDDAVHWGAVN